MKNPLNKRFPRELKSEFGKYLVIFLFIAGVIAIVSGWNVAGKSMSAAYDEGFEKYRIEDGNFELYTEADDELISSLETKVLSASERDENDSTKDSAENGTKDSKKNSLKIYKNFYIERSTEEVDSTLRIFQKRDDVNLECLMEGSFPSSDKEIAIDRMYAENNEISVGDTLTLEGKKFTVSGFVALSDYSALFSNTSDLMFDAVKFGVAIVTEECFDTLGEKGLHLNYSWKYGERPENDEEAKALSEDFLKVLSEQAALHGNAVMGYIPGYKNQAIVFAGEDIAGDRVFINMLLYLVVVIIAFVFAITTSNTIAKEAVVIGTLRATGYTRGELIRHYMAMPLLVTFVAAVVGNILGYTALKDFAASAYYGSYSLPTFHTLWNPGAFVNTTVVPLVIMTLINFVILSARLCLSPLKFMRRDLRRKEKKKAFRLSTKLGILKRFRLRVFFQNLPNYVTIFAGVFLANTILLFGMMFEPMLDKYQEDITTNLLAPHQYVLKMQAETEEKDAEKYAAGALKTMERNRTAEDVSVYGITENSRYVNLDLDGGVYISNAYAGKYDIEAGEKITLKEQFGSEKYTFTVAGIYNYPAALCIFMDRDSFNETFDKEKGYFNGYFSKEEISDIDEKFIATEITEDDLTKTSRQMKLSMGDMMSIFLVFGVVMFMLIVYLLSKIIIEKNAQSISMAKILGYTDGEINSIYIRTTTIVVVLSLLVTIPIANLGIEKFFEYFLRDYSGWLPYYVGADTFVKMAVLGVVSYGVISFAQARRVKRVPLGEALKNVE